MSSFDQLPSRFCSDSNSRLTRHEWNSSRSIYPTLSIVNCKRISASLSHGVKLNLVNLTCFRRTSTFSVTYYQRCKVDRGSYLCGTGWFIPASIEIGRRLNSHVSSGTCLQREARRSYTGVVERTDVRANYTHRNTEADRMRKFYRGNVKNYCRNSCVISFCASAASYVALKVALTNSSRNVVGFLRLGSRKYTKLHLNALFSVQFTRLASTALWYSFLPAENGSLLSFARYFFLFFVSTLPFFLLHYVFGNKVWYFSRCTYFERIAHLYFKFFILWKFFLRIQHSRCLRRVCTFAIKSQLLSVQFKVTLQNLNGTRVGQRERHFDVARCYSYNKGTNERKIKVRSDLEHLPCCTTFNQGALWRDIFQCNFVCESQRWTRMWTN